jgi:hypothetical protein
MTGGPSGRARENHGPVIESAQQVIGTAFDQATAHDDAHARTWVMLVDGWALGLPAGST